jgi:hypothetical protein
VAGGSFYCVRLDRALACTEWSARFPTAMAPSSPMVSHLLFVTDSPLLFKVNRENSKEVRNVLNLYCSASREQINFDKSSIHFAKGCNAGVRSKIKAILNVQK